MPQATAPSRRTSTESVSSPDIIALLKQDHKDVKAMFEEFEALGPRAVAQRQKLGTKITSALATHSQIEETILYPAFKARASDHEELQEVLEAEEEHAIADRLVEQLKALDARDELYEAKMKTLMDAVLHHVKEEEGEFFPSTRKLFSKAELAEFGGRALDVKARAKAA